MTKCIAYIRVSTSDQSNSLEVQKKKIAEYCAFKELEVVEFIADEDVSGGKEFYKRPGGRIAQKHFNNGVTTIVAIKPDRLFRNVKDALITVDDWNKEEIDLHIVDLGGNSLTTKTAIGRLFFTTVIAFAEFERNITGERIKVVLNNKKATMKAYTGQVLGYDNINGQTQKRYSDSLLYLLQHNQSLLFQNLHLLPNWMYLHLIQTVSFLSFLMMLYLPLFLYLYKFHW